MKRLSLRFFLPLLVTGFFLLVTLVAFASSRHFVLEELESKLMQEMRTRLNATQGTLERFLTLRHPEGLKKLISVSGSDLDLRVQFVADRDGKVVSSTNYREEGMHWTELGYGIDQATVERISRTHVSQVDISSDRLWINGYISICDPHASKGLRAQRCGFLFHQIDLYGHRQQAISSLHRQAALATAGFACSALLLLFAVHRLITAKVDRIQQALGRYGDGARETRIGLVGNDELAAIGYQVDGLLYELAADEAELKRNEQFKQAIIDSANASIISTDREGTILTFNAGAERMLGYSAHEVVGRATPSIIHDRSEIEESAAALSLELGCEVPADFEVFVARARRGLVDENEWTYVRKDGSRFPVKLSITAMIDDVGEITGFLGVARDITEDKAMVQSLRLAEQVFESAGEAILVTDAETRILDVNAAYLDMTGYTREEVIGSKPQIAKSGRHDARFYRAMWDSITRTGTWSGELWNRRKDGEIFPQWLTINEIRDDRGSVTNFVGIFTDISHQKAIEERLERMAYYDPLTQLPNRALFRDRLEHEIEVSRRRGDRLAVLFIDLDGFKYVNDSQGHDAGDQLLGEAAKRIQATVRQSDTVARLGGDEFTAILGELRDGREIASVAANLIEVLQERFRIQDKEVYISGSIGVALYPEDGEDFVTLTKNADAAMYQAKQAGRGTYRFFTESLDNANNQRIVLTTGLRGAVAENALYLEYQPKFDVRDGRVLGFEALLRWRHPSLGLVSPGVFIPIAEESGLILQIGEWVLHTACSQLRRWHAEGHPELCIAVNLSMLQIEQGDLVQSVRGVLAETGLRPGALDLEITESMLMSDAERAMAVTNGLRELGVGLTVDDFGTGYSSLSYLKRLPIQTLKIDRSFVRDIVSDPDDAAIVRAVLSMAEQLRLDVVAEGVETQAQHELLRAEGCEQAQGFFYAKPLSVEEAWHFLQRHGDDSRPSDLCEGA